MADLSASQRSKIRRLAQPKEHSPEDVGGELNIVPFLDIIMNVLMFVLATVAVTFTTTIETTPPSSGGKGPRIVTESKSLNLTLFVTNDGVSIKAAGGSIAPGCEGVGPGTTVPTKGSDPITHQPILDYKAVTTCCKRLKDQSQDFKDETQIRITASNNISYRNIVEIIDAVRQTETGEQLFPDVLFAVPR